MSTRSRIAVALPNGRFSSIYCHQDGHPKGVGQVLVEHYGSTERALALVTLGNLSRLRQQLAPPNGVVHTFDKALSCTTVAYGRDRGDKGTGALRSNNFTALVAAASQCNAEFIYVLQADRWQVVPVPEFDCAPLPTEADLTDVEVTA